MELLQQHITIYLLQSWS